MAQARRRASIRARRREAAQAKRRREDIGSLRLSFILGALRNGGQA
jgi:hypothetical protein